MRRRDNLLRAIVKAFDAKDDPWLGAGLLVGAARTLLAETEESASCGNRPETP